MPTSPTPRLTKSETQRKLEERAVPRRDGPGNRRRQPHPTRTTWCSLRWPSERREMYWKPAVAKRLLATSWKCRSATAASTARRTATVGVASRADTGKPARAGLTTGWAENRQERPPLLDSRPAVSASASRDREPEPSTRSDRFRSPWRGSPPLDECGLALAHSARDSVLSGNPPISGHCEEQLPESSLMRAIRPPASK